MYYVGMYQPICTFLIVLVSHFTIFDYLNKNVLTNHLESFFLLRTSPFQTQIFMMSTQQKNMYIQNLANLKIVCVSLNILVQ